MLHEPSPVTASRPRPRPDSRPDGRPIPGFHGVKPIGGPLRARAQSSGDTGAVPPVSRLPTGSQALLPRRNSVLTRSYTRPAGPVGGSPRNVTGLWHLQRLPVRAGCPERRGAARKAGLFPSRGGGAPPPRTAMPGGVPPPGCP
ncbi:hypothetical protein [Azospirillum argentinense]